MSTENFVEVDDYIAALFAPQDGVLAGIEGALKEASIPNLSVTPTQGKLLHLLARISRARRVLEIGTLGGYSTIWLARALPAEGKITTIDRDPKHADMAKRNVAAAGLSDRVDFRLGDALEVLAALEREEPSAFDMIFIDADKTPYPDYLSCALRLSHPGTLIVADNVVRGGRVAASGDGDPSLEAIRTFNKMLAEEPRLSATIIQTFSGKGHDGLAVAVVREE